MPEWQKSVVTEYLDEKANQTLLATYDGYFNRSGRAYPDVAAQGDRYSVYVPGTYNPRNDNSSGWGLIGGKNRPHRVTLAL